MLKASTSRPFGTCMKILLTPVSNIPNTLVRSLPARLVFAVYLGTYATANSIDTLTSIVTPNPTSSVTANTAVFVGTAATSTGLTVYKDSRMVQYLGGRHALPRVPLLTYTSFTVRDTITIFASFNLPKLLAPCLTALPDSVKDKFGRMLKTDSGRLKTAQFTIPAVIQVATTPLHLLGLDIYNKQQQTKFSARLGRVFRDTSVALPVRVARIVPAFGVGGIVNASSRSALVR